MENKKKKLGRLKLNALMLQNKEKYIVRRKKKKKIISLFFTLQFVVSLLNPLTIDK